MPESLLRFHLPSIPRPLSPPGRWFASLVGRARETLQTSLELGLPLNTLQRCGNTTSCVYLCACMWGVTCEGGGTARVRGCGLLVCLVLKCDHLHPGLSSATPAVPFVGSECALVGTLHAPRASRPRGATGTEAISHKESTVPACHATPPPSPLAFLSSS